MAIRLGRAILLAAVAVGAAPTLADDLREALVMAYNTNPTLQGARAQQRAVDAGVPIARSAALPTLNGTVSHTEFIKRSASTPGGPLSGPVRALSADLSAGAPLYAGGAIRNSIAAAKVRVEAGRADLRASETDVFSQVVAAYMDVILGQAVVSLNRGQVGVLTVNLQATRDRFEIGDLTRTDVAQSQARLSLAQGQARSAEAQLIGARERYIAVVGKAPVDLQPPPPLPGLPADVETAVQVALDSNPDLLAARQRSKAAGYDTAVAGSGRLPRVSVFAGAGYTDYYGTLGGGSPLVNQSATDAQAGVRATIPLFQGGLPAAQRRQAQAREGATLEQEIAIERQIIAGVRAAYASWQATREIIESSQSAVDAAKLSLEGVKAENTVGNRTILDILNAEQELLNAQVQLVTAQRNGYVAGFNLLAAMGKAEARDLGLDGGPLYDPVANYDRIAGDIWDWSSDPAPKARATRTVDSKPQDGSVTTK